MRSPPLRIGYVLSRAMGARVPATPPGDQSRRRSGLLKPKRSSCQHSGLFIHLLQHWLRCHPLLGASLFRSSSWRREHRRACPAMSSHALVDPRLQLFVGLPLQAVQGSHRGDPLPHDVPEGQLLLEEVPWRLALSRAAGRGHDAAMGKTRRWQRKRKARRKGSGGAAVANAQCVNGSKPSPKSFSTPPRAAASQPWM